MFICCDAVTPFAIRLLYLDPVVFPIVVQTVIFNDFAKGNLYVNPAMMGELNRAVAKKQISFDFKRVVWNSTFEMRNLYTHLKELERFLSNEVDIQTNKKLEDKYKVPVDILRLEFWQNVLKVPLQK